MKPLFALILAAALTGASTAADPAPPAPVPTPTTPATPDPNDVTQPAGLIRDLYTRYYAELTALDANPDKAHDPALEWDAIYDKYFTPELAARLKKADASEEPVIDWDFFVNGQDYQDLKIISVEAATTGDASKVTIVTSNTGQQSTTLIEMTKAADGWRIADFVFGEGSPDAERLTDYLKKAGY